MSDEPEKFGPAEDDQIDTGLGQQQRKSRMSPALKLGLILGGGVSAIAVVMALSGPDIGGEMQINRPPALDATPGGQTQAQSAEFQESLRQENERRAERAGELGVTSMPTPEVILQPRPRVEPVEGIPVVERMEAQVEPVRQVQPATRRILPSSPAPQPPIEEPRQVSPAEVVSDQAQPQRPATEEEEQNPFLTGMIRQMGVVTQRQSPTGMGGAEVSSSARRDAGAAGQPGLVPGDGAAPAETLTVLRPGDILYGETITTVDSDMQSPVLVEIVAGDFKGARLVGEFTSNRRAEALVVNFTNITLPDGTTTPLSAFAVDGRSAQTAVASDVERRYISRYGPILAATFLSSYAQAQAQPQRIVTGAGQDIEVNVSAPTARQALFAGLSSATNVIAQDIMQGAPIGPRIVLRSGYPIAVLIAEPVSVPAPVAPQN